MESWSDGPPPRLPRFQVCWNETLAHDRVQDLSQDTFVIVEDILLENQRSGSVSFMCKTWVGKYDNSLPFLSETQMIDISKNTHLCSLYIVSHQHLFKFRTGLEIFVMRSAGVLARCRECLDSTEITSPQGRQRSPTDSENLHTDSQIRDQRVLPIVK